jgi:hypothetical protein
MHFCFIFKIFAFQGVHGSHFRLIFDFIFDFIFVCLQPKWLKMIQKWVRKWVENGPKMVTVNNPNIIHPLRLVFSNLYLPRLKVNQLSEETLQAKGSREVWDPLLIVGWSMSSIAHDLVHKICLAASGCYHRVFRTEWRLQTYGNSTKAGISARLEIDRGLLKRYITGPARKTLWTLA